MKPIIGIVEWPYRDIDNDSIYEVMSDIVKWVNYSGGIPVGIFPTQVENFLDKKLIDIEPMSFESNMDLIDSLDRCDAIIKPGALKIYEHEKFIHGYTVEKNIPYLGICAGMQIMSAYNSKLNNIKNETKIDHKNSNHDVMIIKNTLLRSIIDKDIISVISRHSYHIASSGVNNISAIADEDIIEAIENRECDFNLGLQWHPELEELGNSNTEDIFGSLVEYSKRYSKRKM